MNKLMNSTAIGAVEHNAAVHDLDDQPKRNPHELMSRDQIEREYGLSRRWLELAACRGDGPPMIRISWRMVRYRRGDFEAWLTSREVANTVQTVGGE